MSQNFEVNDQLFSLAYKNDKLSNNFAVDRLKNSNLKADLNVPNVVVMNAIINQGYLSIICNSVLPH